jgi:helicase required for RNAi-mediated heterochromatin assembly 1
MVVSSVSDLNRFPLSRYVVCVDKKMEPPSYVQNNPKFDLTPLEIPKKPGFENTLIEAVDDTNYAVVNVLKDFPEDLLNGMDKSQLLACKSMLTQQVAIIQGPPGTGKTFVSVAGLKVLIHNLGPYDPPIIVAAQTNHALDQLLNHILEFEPKVVRIGGRCDKKNEKILERTLFELRGANPDAKEIRTGLAGCFRDHKNICREIMNILAPLTDGSILSAETLLEHGILTEKHVASLKKGTKGKGPGTWGDDDDSDSQEDGSENEATTYAPEGSADIRDCKSPTIY